MIINLKIEILKVFSFEFNLSSDKELKLRKGKPDDKEIASNSTSSAIEQPGKR